MADYTAISSLLPWVKVYVPEQPDNMITDAIKAAFLEFHTKSAVLIEEIDITTVVDQAAYTLTVTTTDHEPYQIDRVAEINDDGDEAGDYNEAVYYYTDTDNKINFKKPAIPGAAGDTRRVFTVLRPETRADTYLAWIVTRWGKMIADGAAAELLKIPGRPSTNPALSEMLKTSFRRAINEGARYREDKGRRMELSWSP